MNITTRNKTSKTEKEYARQEKVKTGYCFTSRRSKSKYMSENKITTIF